MQTRTPYRPSDTVTLADNGVGCEACQFTGWLYRVAGARRGVSECDCLTRWRLKPLFERVPYDHQQFIHMPLSEVKPRVECHTKQAVVVAHIQANPYSPLLLCGWTDAGKSGLAWALFCQAAREGRKVFCFSLIDLLDRWQQFDTGKSEGAAPPLDLTVFSERPRSPQDSILVFLDEIVERKPTEYRTAVFKRILEATTSNGHQLICTSQLPVQPGPISPINGQRLQTLREWWSTANWADGEPIERRLIKGRAGEACHTVFEMF